MLDSNQLQTWPPAYILKKHRRAKRVKLHISASRGLIVTVPYRFSIKEVPSVLEEHKDWIINHFAKLPIKSDELPETINFFGGEISWSIMYVESKSRWELIEKPGHQLVIIGKISHKDSCKKHLVAWVKQKAFSFLENELNSVCQRMTLVYRTLSIRDQKTMWGSCTSQKNISLNYKLIFLPRYLINYVLIHELCHTKHLNHSMAFWRLVASFDEQFRQNQLELRKGDQFIPGWIL